MEFPFYASMQQSYMFFRQVRIEGVDIEAEDWVVVYHQGKIVGARQWGACSTPPCDVPLNGSDGTTYTSGYLNTGDVPTFSIYDSSEGIFHDAQPSDPVVFQPGEMRIIARMDSQNMVCSDPFAANFSGSSELSNGTCQYKACLYVGASNLGEAQRCLFESPLLDAAQSQPFDATQDGDINVKDMVAMTHCLLQSTETCTAPTPPCCAGQNQPVSQKALLETWKSSLAH